MQCDVFTWKAMHEELLLREVLVLEPFKYRQGSKDRGATWTQIAKKLSEMGMKASQRSVREQFEKLVKEFKRKETIEEQESGIDAEYTERDRTMIDILERMHECDMQLESNIQKEIKEKETAEEMRREATDSFGETRKRRCTKENEKLITPERKRIRNSDVMDVLKGSLEMKKKEQEQAKELRERELNFMESQLMRQEEFIRSIMKQQQQFQQQQQAVTMSILNTLAQTTKSLNK